MVRFPNCKINLGLEIGTKRPDGFHSLETVFIPLPLTDVLEIITAGINQQENVAYSSSGLTIEGSSNENLCVRAYDLVKADYPAMPAIRMHLHKHIPMGAGLGGGSADAAYTLQMLDSLFGLMIPEKKMQEYALQLGSDCPFFLYNKTVIARGRGEILEPISLDLSSYNVVLIHPGIHVNTAWAFSKLDKRSKSEVPLSERISKDILTWKDNIVNDFEVPVFQYFPEIESIKNELYKAGALYASLSGSGSSVYGIFKWKTVPEINFPPHYFCRTV